MNQAKLQVLNEMMSETERSSASPKAWSIRIRRSPSRAIGVIQQGLLLLLWSGNVRSET